MLAEMLSALALAAGSPDPSAAPGVGGVVSPPHLLGGPAFMVDDDYPAEALKLRQAGVTRAAVQISPKGKVEGCRIVESSNAPSLDQATCAMLSKLRYAPARDADGKAVAGEFVRKMNWTLPQH